jgi:hypothetical protein
MLLSRGRSSESCVACSREPWSRRADYYFVHWPPRPSGVPNAAGSTPPRERVSPPLRRFPRVWGHPHLSPRVFARLHHTLIRAVLFQLHGTGEHSNFSWASASDSGPREHQARVKLGQARRTRQETGQMAGVIRYPAGLVDAGWRWYAP